MEQTSTQEEERTPPVEQKQAPADGAEEAPATSEKQSPTQANPWHHDDEDFEKYIAERDTRFPPVHFSVDRFAKYRRDLWNFVSQNNCEWILPEGIRSLADNYGWFQIELEGWLYHRTISRAELEGLPDAQKRLIVSSLKGSLVQDDLDTTMSLLPNHIRNGFACVLLESVVVQHAFARMFDNPFWYFDGEAEQLNQLYRKFIQTSKPRAALWRCDTIRLANSVKHSVADDLTLGQYNQERRDAAVAEFAAEIVSSEPFKLLLKPFADAEEEAKELEYLARIYKTLADMLVKVFAHPALPRVRWIDDLEVTFTADLKTMAASSVHFLDRGDRRLDGRRVLMVRYPALVGADAVRDWPLCPESVRLEADVLVADPPSPNDSG
ncbi:hypothetical protein ATERTT37_001207 [Aspergillus terreus]